MIDLINYINEEIKLIEEDRIFKDKPASIFLNAPLAIIQSSMSAKLQTLKIIREKLTDEFAKIEATEQTYWLKDADFVFDSICDYDLEPSPGEVFEFEMWKRTKSEEIYVVPIFSDEDNFDYVEFLNKGDADKAAADNKAMIEAAQENGDE